MRCRTCAGHPRQRSAVPAIGGAHRMHTCVSTHSTWREGRARAGRAAPVHPKQEENGKNWSTQKSAPPRRRSRCARSKQCGGDSWAHNLLNDCSSARAGVLGKCQRKRGGSRQRGNGGNKQVWAGREQGGGNVVTHDIEQDETGNIFNTPPHRQHSYVPKMLLRCCMARGAGICFVKPSAIIFSVGQY